jgi:DNA-binding transcriptional MocR family regulator
LRNRSIRVPGSQVLIVNGAQQGLAIAVSVLLKPGDMVVADPLTYPGMKALAPANRLDLLSLPIAGEGMNLDALEALCQERPVRAVYAMPTMHNPLGWLMPERDRTVALACQWIESGAVDELEDRKRADAAVRQLLARKILAGAKLVSHPSSYFLWLELPDYLRADVVAADLRRGGVIVTTAEPFSIGSKSPQALRVALGSISFEALERALRLVGRAVGLH